MQSRFQAAIFSLVFSAACGESDASMAGPEGSTPAGPVGDGAGSSDVDGDSGDALNTPSTEDDSTASQVDYLAIPSEYEDVPQGVFIPAYLDCREPMDGDSTEADEGLVCTETSISGCTEPGKYYADYASCGVVQTQRPFWRVEPDEMPSDDDPRLNDAEFMGELAWVTEQVEACACVCCHDSDVSGAPAGGWDIRVDPIWTDTIDDTGVAMLAGLAESGAFGAYPPEANHGFDRSVTGLPTTDIERMRTFFLAELDRRGLSQEWAAAVPDFGGPLVFNALDEPDPCDEGLGVDAQGMVTWKGGNARYVWVLENGSLNPGVPPNLDVPDGTLWKLDVSPLAEAVSSGILYGEQPDGAAQSMPILGPAPELTPNETYQLYVLRDVGLPITNCLFTAEG